MPFNPATPPSKQNGNGLQDPFTDEKNVEWHPKANRDASVEKRTEADRKRDGLMHKEEGEEGHEEETPTLFYAYARRSDNHWSSRYLLTFASSHVCAEWWTLVQSEYPSQAVRHGPQLFSFVGDDFPKKPATSKRFEHLKTKWFYSQFGDASGTGGRTQEILPLQDWDGRIITGGGDAGAGSPRAKIDKGKARAREGADEEGYGADSYGRGSGDSWGVDFSGLAESLQSAASIAETNNAQVSQLAESQSHTQDLLAQSQAQAQQTESRMARIEALVLENAQQLQALSKSHVKAQAQNRELAEQNAKILRELKRQRTQAQRLFEQALKAEKEAGGKQEGREREREREAGELEPNFVVVHPPPRKIDRTLVGYAYHADAGQGSEGPPKLGPAKGAQGSPAKRPPLGGRTAKSSGALGK